MQYYALTGREDKLEEEGFGEYYEFKDVKSGRGITVIDYGSGDGWKKSEQPITSPEQFIQQIKRDLAEAEQKIAESPPIDDYYEEFKQKGDYGNEEAAQADFEYYNMKIYSPGGNEKAYFKSWAQRQKDTLNGFTKAALESGDPETAIEGFATLEKLDDPEVVTQLRDKMLELRQSENQEDKQKLLRASKKLQEVSARARGESAEE